MCVFLDQWSEGKSSFWADTRRDWWLFFSQKPVSSIYEMDKSSVAHCDMGWILWWTDVIRDLSFNELYGDIPFSISKLKQLEFL